MDILFPIADDKVIGDFIKQYTYLPWPFMFDKQLFINWHGKNKEPVFIDIIHAASRLYSDLNKEAQLTFVNWNPSDPLANIFEAMYGSLPSSEDIDVKFKYDELLSGALSNKNFYIRTKQAIPAQLHNNLTINRLTSYLLSGQGSIGWRDPGFYVGNANDFYDLINFWNLRACGVDLVFYDQIFKNRFKNIKNSFIKKILTSSTSTYEYSSRIGIWLKEENYDTFDKKDFEGPLTICPVHTDIWNGKNVKASNWHFKSNTVLGILSESPGHTLSFQLPEKPSAEQMSDSNQHMIASIEFI